MPGRKHTISVYIKCQYMHHTISPNLQQQQLHGPLRGGADQLQALPAAAVLQGGLQQADHRVVVAELEEPLNLLQRLTALQRLQPLLDLPTEEREPRDETRDRDESPIAAYRRFTIAAYRPGVLFPL